MTPPSSWFVRLGLWLRRKRNGCIFGVIAFGVPMWALFLWHLRSSLTADLVAVIGVLCVGGGLAWGFLMWHFFNFAYPPEERGKDVT